MLILRGNQSYGHSLSAADHVVLPSMQAPVFIRFPTGFEDSREYFDICEMSRNVLSRSSDKGIPDKSVVS